MILAESAGISRLFDSTGMFDHVAVRIVCIATAASIVLGLLASVVLNAKNPALAKDIRTRTLMWIVLAAAVIVPILAFRAGAMMLVLALSLLCYREFARGTGLFRFRLVSGLVVLGILCLTFTHVDHWPGLRVGLVAIIPAAIVVLSVLEDRPEQYIMRCALGTSAFLLLGVGLGRLGDLANHTDYRALLLAIIFSCQGADVAAYCFGKALGGRHVFPNTSPKKTLGGHVGALALIAPASAYLYHLVFAGTVLEAWGHCVTLGVMTAVLAQMGDLVMGSIKRDLGVKDLANILPGHGGVLDRCNSLLLVAPAVYHYVQFYIGVAADAPVRIITGGVGVAAGGMP